MDINSLLSPSESPAPRANSQTPVATTTEPQSPRKPTHRQSSGGQLQQIKAASPARTASGIPQHVLSPRQPLIPAVSSPLASPHTTGSSSATSNGTHLQASISSSSSNMEALADIASMQNHQPTVPRPQLPSSHGSWESQLSPSTIFPTVPTVSITSNPRSSVDIAMPEAPRQTVRTDFAGTSLPLELQQQAKELSTYLQANSSAYETHVALINLLHEGFVNHVYPPASPNDRGDPRTYDLLPDLRHSRDNMSKLFAVGEDLWADWIQDESMLAQSVEEQIDVLEKCRQAVQEEFASTKLWTMCGDWVLHCYKSAHEAGGVLSEADQMVGQELFTWSQVLDTWREATEQTSYRLHDSHLIWDRHIKLHVPRTAHDASCQLGWHIFTVLNVRHRTLPAKIRRDYGFYKSGSLTCEAAMDGQRRVGAETPDGAESRR